MRKQPDKRNLLEITTNEVGFRRKGGLFFPNQTENNIIFPNLS